MRATDVAEVPVTAPPAFDGTWELARALCDSSWHISIMPHEDQRPCEYHRERARDTLALLARHRVTLARILPPAVMRAPLAFTEEIV